MAHELPPTQQILLVSQIDAKSSGIKYATINAQNKTHI